MMESIVKSETEPANDPLVRYDREVKRRWNQLGTVDKTFSGFCQRIVANEVERLERERTVPQ